MNTIVLECHSLDGFHDHVIQTAAELEEITGDLYALESMISITHDVEDLNLYQTHCRRLEATIYTLHEKIGSWQHSVQKRKVDFQNNNTALQTYPLDKPLMLVEDCIAKIGHQEEKIMRLQQLLRNQRSLLSKKLGEKETV